MPFAEVTGTRLFYTDEGTGNQPILLVHGWTCDSLDWSWQLDAFAARHRVIAPDLSGHGRSSAGGTYTVRAFAAELEALLAELDCGPIVGIGHSLGAMVVSAMAVEHPSAVRAVVAVDPSYGLGDDLSAAVEGMIPQLQGAAAPEVVAAMFAQAEGPDTPAGLRALHRQRVLGMAPELVTAVSMGALRTDDQFAMRPEATRYLGRRECPVLAVWADPERAAWEATVLRHPYSRVVCWEGCGHWLHQERPEDFNALVLDWITALPT